MITIVKKNENITHLRSSERALSHSQVTCCYELRNKGFILIYYNKPRILTDPFQDYSVEAKQAKGDADLLTIKTVIEKSIRQELWYTKNTELLVLLCHLIN